MTKTLNDIFIECRAKLSSELEARELCAYALNIDRFNTLDWAYRFIGEDSVSKIYELLDRRLYGEPLAYILGEWEFYSLPFKVNPSVLIPRADTETLVDSAIQFLKTLEAPKVLDLCSGSGCIGISIAKNIEDSKVTAVDISKDALDIARENAILNKVHQRYMLLNKDVLEKPKTLGKYDIIVSNPPYIKSNEILTLDTDVKDFEPMIALDGGQDGLVFYEKICENYFDNIKYGGKIMFEYGIHQEDDIKKIMERCGFINIEIKQDLCNINRIIEGTRPLFNQEEKNG